MDFCVYQLSTSNLQNIISLLPFYVYLPTGVQLTSKNEVLCYMDDGELPESVNGDCDTSTKHNVRED
jgi:hypothetical protein